MSSLEILAAIAAAVATVFGAFLKYRSTSESEALKRDKILTDMINSNIARVEENNRRCEQERAAQAAQSAAQAAQIAGLQHQIDAMLITSKTGISDAQVVVDAAGIVIDCDGVPVIFAHRSAAILNHPLPVLTDAVIRPGAQVAVAHHAGGYDVAVSVVVEAKDNGHKLMIHPIQWRL